MSDATRKDPIYVNIDLLFPFNATYAAFMGGMFISSICFLSSYSYDMELKFDKFLYFTSLLSLVFSYGELTATLYIKTKKDILIALMKGELNVKVEE